MLIGCLRKELGAAFLPENVSQAGESHGVFVLWEITGSISKLPYLETEAPGHTLAKLQLVPGALCRPFLF